MQMDRSRYIASFVIIMLSIGVNVGQHLLAQLNIDRNYLLITLLAITIAGLIAHRHLLFIVLVSGLTLTINIPQELLDQYNINSNILFATLLGLIIAPIGVKLFGFNSRS